MKKTLIIMLIAVLAVALGSVGCGSKESEVAVEPESPAEELAAEVDAEAARREQETSSLGDRLGELTDSVRALSGGGDAGLPADLAAGMETVSSKVAEAERLLGELKSASGDAWQSAKARLETALGDLDSARSSAAAAAAEWQAKVAAAAAARSEGGSVVNWDTGLLEGLDGGEYPQYLPSALAKVQERLRGLGYYAGPADGTFCKPTLDAVGAFQEAEGLHVSGVPSPMTRASLFADAD